MVARIDPRGMWGITHSTVSDSVMNYNVKLWMNVDDSGGTITDETDCSLQPFDMMAIYALYQTVD